MAKPLSTSVEVPADVETTWRLMTGPSWPQAQDAALHDGSTLVSSEPTPAGGATLVVSRLLPDGIPGFMQAFTPKDGRVTQTDVWEPASGGCRRGTWNASFPGSPGTIEGRTTIEPTATGCRWHVEGSVRVKVPLLGGRIEAFLAPLVERLVDKQGEVLVAQLS